MFQRIKEIYANWQESRSMKTDGATLASPSTNQNKTDDLDTTATQLPAGTGQNDADLQALKDQQAIDDKRIMLSADERDAQNAADEASMNLVRRQGEDHKHKFKRGVLPGGKYVKTCDLCGEIVSIDFTEWQVLA